MHLHALMFNYTIKQNQYFIPQQISPQYSISRLCVYTCTFPISFNDHGAWRHSLLSQECFALPIIISVQSCLQLDNDASLLY